MAEHTDHRATPRRRGQELIDAILQAASDEILEVGFQGLSYESVARRAGASKVSIYRRWPTKEELVRAAARQHTELPTLPQEPSSLRSDLIAVFSSMAHQIEQPAGMLVRSLLAASLAQQAPSMSEMSWGMGPGMMRLVVERALRRGELAGAPNELVLRAPVDVFKQRFISHGAVSEEFIKDLVEQIALPLWTGRLEH